MHEPARGFNRGIPLTETTAIALIQMDVDVRKEHGTWPPIHCYSGNWFALIDAARELLGLPDLSQYPLPLPPSGAIVTAKMRQGNITSLMRCKYESDPETQESTNVQWFDLDGNALNVYPGSIISLYPYAFAYLYDTV